MSKESYSERVTVNVRAIEEVGQLNLEQNSRKQQNLYSKAMLIERDFCLFVVVWITKDSL